MEHLLRRPPAKAGAPSSDMEPIVSKPAKFIVGSLMRHIVVMSVTSSVGLLTTMGVEFVDLLYIAQLDDESLMAAVGYAGTVLFFIIQINIGIMIAVGVVVSNAIGGEAPAATTRLITSAMLWSVSVNALISLATYCLLDVLVAALGASGDDATSAVRYLSIVVPAGPLSAASMTASSVLRAYGDAQAAMLCTLVSCVVNAVADPLLIFVAGLGLRGAAWSTVLARVANLGCALWILMRTRLQSGFLVAPEAWADCRKLGAMAVPAILTNLATPIGGAFATREMALYGAEGVAAMAIVSRLTPIAFSCVFTASGAVGPIIGQNNGAGRYDRVRETYRAALLFVTAVVLGATLLLFVLRAPLAAVFQAEGEARELLYLFCGPLAWTCAGGRLDPGTHPMRMSRARPCCLADRGSKAALSQMRSTGPSSSATPCATTSSIRSSRPPSTGRATPSARSCPSSSSRAGSARRGYSSGERRAACSLRSSAWGASSGCSRGSDEKTARRRSRGSRRGRMRLEGLGWLGYCDLLCTAMELPQ